MFQTNEPVVSTFLVVSLRRLASVWLAANMTYGGSKVRLLNWLRGGQGFDFSRGSGLVTGHKGRVITCKERGCPFHQWIL